MVEIKSARLSTGVTLPYVEQGDPSGVPLVMLHAWGESSGVFDRLLTMLPAQVHAVAMDQRGHGTADKPRSGYALADYAADVVAFMDAIGLDEACILGSSSGGYVAQKCAVGNPERVRGLILVGSPRSLRGRPTFADEVDQLVDPIDPAWVRNSLTWFPTFHPIPAGYIDDRVADGVGIPAHVWRQALTGLIDATPPVETGTITAPTLIVWGGRDDLLPRADADRLAKEIPGATLVVYEDAGHLVLWEEPERIAADAASFVRGLA